MLFLKLNNLTFKIELDKLTLRFIVAWLQFNVDNLVLANFCVNKFLLIFNLIFSILLEFVAFVFAAVAVVVDAIVVPFNSSSISYCFVEFNNFDSFKKSKKK